MGQGATAAGCDTLHDRTMRAEIACSPSGALELSQYMLAAYVRARAPVDDGSAALQGLQGAGVGHAAHQPNVAPLQFRQEFVRDLLDLVAKQIKVLLPGVRVAGSPVRIELLGADKHWARGP